MTAETAMRIETEALALKELTELTGFGPRFHGGPAIRQAQALLTSWLEAAGAQVRTHEVRTPGWEPGGHARVAVTAPVTRDLVAWPMLWSGSSSGVLRARLQAVGVQGLWGDSMVWTKFAALVDGEVVAYVHARDGGPAAPQPLPVGSDTTVAHLAIGRMDGLAITEWLADGHEVEVELEARAAHLAEAVSESLLVDLPGGTEGQRVIVCGHYDTFWNTPGAYDNGSGTIALVHLVRRLLAAPPARPVTVAFMTAEEWHLAGSRALVDHLTPAEREELDFVINLDGLGRGDFLEVFAGPETFERDFLAELRSYASKVRPGLRIQSRFPPTCGTDQASFYAAGIPAVHMTFNDLHRLHQPDDLPNEGIARNIAWTVPLVEHLVSALGRADRVPPRAMSMPF